METEKLNGNRTFLYLVFFLLLINLPSLLNYTFFFHDTLYSFVLFHLAYSEFFFNRELLQWLPFSTYGVQNDFLGISLLSPANYFVGIIGGILKIRSVLLLYKISLFLEQLIFLAGMYALSKSLFKNKATIAVVCISSIGSTVLLTQIGLNFRFYYCIPLAIYFLRLFLTKYKPQFLVLTLNILILSVLGSAPYCAVIIFFEFFLIFIFLLPSHCRDLRRFLDIKRKDVIVTGILLIGLALVTYAFFYISLHLNDFTEILSSGRDPVTKKTPLDVFLTYGGQVRFKKFLDLFVPKYFTHYFSDMSLYIGLIPLPFIIYGISKARNPMWYALATTVVVMGLFSLGGIVSRAFYYIVPGMKYYRHIGLTIGSFKMFLPLLAGFGIDYLLERSDTKIFSFWRAVISVTLFGGGIMYYVITNYVSRNPGSTKNVALAYVFLVLGIILILSMVYKKFLAKKHFILVLVVSVCFEIIGYQAIVDTRFHKLIKEIPEDFKTVKRYAFQQERSILEADQSKAGVLNVLEVQKKHFALYALYYNFLQWDTCASSLRVDYINAYVASLIRLRDGVIDLWKIVLPADRLVLNSIGCQSKKLRLTTNVIFAKDEDGVKEFLASNENVEDVVILNNVPEDVQKGWINYSRTEGKIMVEDFSSNGISIDVSIPENSGAWLYYADAYHPAWRAFVNGIPVPIAQANIGFKAIRLAKGESKVRFIYDNKKIKYSFYILIGGSIIFMLFFLKFLVNAFKDSSYH